MISSSLYQWLAYPLGDIYYAFLLRQGQIPSLGAIGETQFWFPSYGIEQNVYMSNKKLSK